MIDNIQCNITIYYTNGSNIKIEDRVFNDRGTLNKCFNEINKISCVKEVWLDETYVSFKFKTVKGFRRALRILEYY